MFAKKTLTLMASLTALSSVAWAQTAPPAHHGLMGKLFHHPMTMKPGMTPMHHPMLPFHHSATAPGMMNGRSITPPPSGGTPMAGGVIGNTKTHVYHLPGDSSLPSPKNRRYFASASAAQAAGYHASGSAHGTGGHSTHKMTGRSKHSH